jgi:hypothetical protein
LTIELHGLSELDLLIPPIGDADWIGKKSVLVDKVIRVAVTIGQDELGARPHRARPVKLCHDSLELNSDRQNKYQSEDQYEDERNYGSTPRKGW